MSNAQYTLLHTEPMIPENTEEKEALRGASFWNEEDALVDRDFEPPCPVIARYCPYPCCCCCVFSRAQKQQCAMTLLYNKAYLVVYLLIIAMTLTLLIYDLANGNIISEIQSEPLWFVSIDITCIGLMVFDVIVQIQAHPTSYWKSAMNIFDFIVVILCVVSLPIYFFMPDSDFILTVILLLRFAARLLRILMIYKHHENRSAFMETTRDDLVDFTGLQSAQEIESAQGRSVANNAQPSSYQNPSIQNDYQNVANSVVSRNYNPQWEM